MAHKLTIQEGENGQGPMKVFIINQPVKNVIQGKSFSHAVFSLFYDHFQLQFVQGRYSLFQN